MIFARESSVDVNPSPATFTITPHGSAWLWTVCAMFAIAFLLHAVYAYTQAPKKRLVHFLNMFIAFFMSITYFTMASNLGSTPVQAEFFYTRLADGLSTTGYRQIFYAKYIGWFLALPCVIVEIAISSGAFFSQLFSALFGQEVFVVMLLIGSLIHSSYKWGYFVYAIAGSALVVYELLVQFPRASSSFKSSVAISAVYTVLLVCQILQWALTDGSSVIGMDSSTIFWGIIDLAQFLFLPLYVAWTTRAIDDVTFPAIHEKEGRHSGATAAEPVISPVPAGTPVNPEAQV